MSASYAIKEIFWTLQGEGARSGTPAVFVRFSGCNLWSGREEDRLKGRGACALWCDTDFYGGGKLDKETIVEAVNTACEINRYTWVVFTGGEPCLQLDKELLIALRSNGHPLAVETNGTVPNPALRMCDHICVSPKLGTPYLPTHELGFHVDEVKVVIPGVGHPKVLPKKGWRQSGWKIHELEALSDMYLGAEMFLQPQDDVDAQDHIAQCVQLLKRRPDWRMSVQTHKVIGLP